MFHYKMFLRVSKENWAEGSQIGLRGKIPVLKVERGLNKGEKCYQKPRSILNSVVEIFQVCVGNCLLTWEAGSVVLGSYWVENRMKHIREQLGDEAHHCWGTGGQFLSEKAALLSRFSPEALRMKTAELSNRIRSFLDYSVPILGLVFLFLPWKQVIH